ncbi:MAG: UbiA-like polyprenyltransferase [Planctomycetota bacterium]
MSEINPPVSKVWSSVQIWAEMVKLSHSIFALPFAFIAAFLAGRHVPGRGWPFWGQLGLVVMGMVSARSVAMTFNRIVDAQIDARNPRTAQRPLPSGRLSFATAWLMWGLSALTFGLACMGFFIFYDNSWPVIFSGPVLAILCGYSFTKRFTKCSHVYLGAAISMSPVAAWIAVHPESIGLSTWLLMIVVTCWVGGFDIIYACQDIEIDRRDHLHSLPSRVGPRISLWIAKGLHLLVVVGLLALGWVEALGAWYHVGVILAAILLLVENLLVRPGDYRMVNVAFFTINGIVSLVVAFTTIMDILWSSPS